MDIYTKRINFYQGIMSELHKVTKFSHRCLQWDQLNHKVMALKEARELTYRRF